MQEGGKQQGWVVSGFFNGLQKLSIPLFGILTTMLLAKEALTKAEMGEWALFLVITSFVELIRQALVKTALIKFINHSGEEEHRFVLSAAFLLNAFITLLLLLVMLVFAGQLSVLLKAPGLETMLFLFTPGMLLLIPFSHFEWIMYGKSDFKGLFATYFVRQGLTLLLMVAGVLAYGKVSTDWLVLIFSIGILAGAFVGYRYVRQYFTHTLTWQRNWIGKLWHFGKYVLGSGVSTLVFANAGQMMLSPLLGSTVYTASQSIAARVVNLTDMPSQVVSDILFPKSARKENAANKGLIKYYYEKSVGATLSFALPLVAFTMIFPKFIILVLADEQYLDAVPYLQWIAVTGLFLAFLKQWGVIIDSSGRPHINFFLITFAAVLNVALTYWLILAQGFLGAAYALVLSHIVAFIITQYLLNKYYGIHFFNCFKYAFQFYPEMWALLKSKLKK